MNHWMINHHYDKKQHTQNRITLPQFATNNHNKIISFLLFNKWWSVWWYIWCSICYIVLHHISYDVVAFYIYLYIFLCIFIYFYTFNKGPLYIFIYFLYIFIFLDDFFVLFYLSKVAYIKIVSLMKYDALVVIWWTGQYETFENDALLTWPTTCMIHWMLKASFF